MSRDTTQRKFEKTGKWVRCTYERPVPEDLRVGDEIEVPGTMPGDGPIRTRITGIRVFYEVEARDGEWNESITRYRRNGTRGNLETTEGSAV